MMMQRFTLATLALFVGLATQGCAEGDSEGASQASVDACTPGLEACPCAQGGACTVGLECISNTCVDPSMGGTTATTSGGGSDTGTSVGSAGSANSGEPSSSTGLTGGNTTDDGPCSTNDECAGNELCFDGLCIAIADLYFDVTVSLLDPPNCSDGWGDAELYYDYYHDSEFISSSSISSCPGSWESETVKYDSLRSFELEFWESDAIDDDFVTSLCWGQSECDVVPHSILREGSWEGYDYTGEHYIALDFTPTLF